MTRKIENLSNVSIKIQQESIIDSSLSLSLYARLFECGRTMFTDTTNGIDDPYGMGFIDDFFYVGNGVEIIVKMVTY